MSDSREDLADLIYRTLNPEIQQDEGWLPTIDGTGNVVSHIAADAVIDAGWSPPSHNAFGAATAAAAKLGMALAEFQNALDALARATPHCDECHWATTRGHRRSCRSQDTISPQV
jgi:hypothetical protein